MITRTPEQQLLYNARLKFQRDEAARLEYAKEQGRTEGRTEGEQIGQIRLLEQILELPQTASDDLAKLNADELATKKPATCTVNFAYDMDDEFQDDSCSPRVPRS